jgi:TRAP-type mannitol/chloroaromatic compound transport system permease large subunit
MSKDWIIWAVTIWIVVFMAAGQAVATCLLGAGLLGIMLWMGPGVLNGIVGTDTFYTASTYTLSIIPLYLLMAQLLLKGGVIVDLFRVGHRIAGYRRFPLGVATLITGGLLGAVSGSGTASAAALATLAGPELQRVGYTRSFSVALAAVSGSLSVIIPPSLLIMIYGSLTETPIGHLSSVRSDRGCCASPSMSAASTSSATSFPAPRMACAAPMRRRKTRPRRAVPSAPSPSSCC